MAKAIQKIKLSPSRDIPFNKLVLSQSNVRRVKAGVSIEDLAEDIARRTMLQSLNVRPVLDGEGQETGMFEVPAGGRRYRALELLVKQKRLAKTAPVPCVVREADTDIAAEEDSLAENVQREELHPLDQFRAFRDLRESGLGEEDIAARFFVTPAVVKQRLRLASVSPKLHEVYAEDGMTLDQLIAFAVTDDHERQEQVWESVSRSGHDEAFQIRRLLTERTVRASDKRARFVGLDAYQAAGGVVMRDLFEVDDGGWLADAGLVERLVAEKLKATSEAVAAEGWKWVEAEVTFPYNHDHGLREIEGVAADLTADEQATLDALKSEYARIEAEYEGADELPDDVDARLGEIEEALSAFDDRPMVFDPDDIARAGVFISIDADGSLLVQRGFVRPEDEPPAVEPGVERAEPEESGHEPPHKPARGAVISIAGQSDADEDDDDAARPLPDRLVMELTAHRTLALQDAVAGHPHVAMTALLHRLCLDAFYNVPTPGCLEAVVRHVRFQVQASDLKDSPSAKSIAERHENWKTDVPTDEAALWDWLAALDEASRAALLAHCVSHGVNALFEKVDRYGGPGISAHGLRCRLDQADHLARAVGLNMIPAGWQPTVENYLGRITKPRILAAVREAKGDRAAQLIEHLKKAEMAARAQELLDGSGWLPEPLRTPNLPLTPMSQAPDAAEPSSTEPASVEMAATGYEAAIGNAATPGEDEPAAVEPGIVAAE